MSDDTHTRHDLRDPGPVSPPPYGVTANRSTPETPGPAIVSIANDLEAVLARIEALTAERTEVWEKLDRIDRTLEEAHKNRRDITRALRTAISETDPGDEASQKEAWRG